VRAVVAIALALSGCGDLYPQLDPARYGDGTPCSKEHTCPPGQTCQLAANSPNCVCYSSDLGVSSDQCQPR
jgi:hypothetical protein